MDLEKAKLMPAEGGGESLDFMFNPTQLVFSRSAKWEPAKGSRNDGNLLPKVSFSGVDPYQLTISDVLFDTYETGKSVSEYIRKFQAAVDPPSSQSGAGQGSSGGSGSNSGKSKRPPVYIFRWGAEQTFSFRCVVKKLDFTYTMFLPDGTPVRAKMTLSLQEVDKGIGGGSQRQNAGPPDRSQTRESFI
jgi:hypothetical protein